MAKPGPSRYAAAQVATVGAYRRQTRVRPACPATPAWYERSMSVASPAVTAIATPAVAAPAASTSSAPTSPVRTPSRTGSGSRAHHFG